MPAPAPPHAASPTASTIQRMPLSCADPKRGARARENASMRVSEPPKAPPPLTIRPRGKRPSPEKLAERAKMHGSRVDLVAELMRSLKYRWDTGDVLAAQWGIPRSAMAKIAVEASRRVRAELTDPDRVMSRVSVALEHVIEDAIASGDRHAVIKAADLLVRITGAGAPTKVEVSQDLSGLTIEQIRARKEELLSRLAGKPIQLPALEEHDGAAVPAEGDDDAAR